MAAVGMGLFWAFMFRLHRALAYDGNRKLDRDIIEGLAAYVDLPPGGVALDVGCGSGALTIVLAKRNPEAGVLGVDRWGKEYASFSQKLCQENAKAEEVSNVRFQKGDALKLPFPDDSFDCVTSNYVYHNINGCSRQDLLLESLRTLKKGGIFAIHDIFSKMKYGETVALMSRK